MAIFLAPIATTRVLVVAQHPRMVLLKIVRVLAEEILGRKGARADVDERCTLSAQKAGPLLIYRNTKVLRHSPTSISGCTHDTLQVAWLVRWIPSIALPGV